MDSESQGTVENGRSDSVGNGWTRQRSRAFWGLWANFRMAPCGCRKTRWRCGWTLHREPYRAALTALSPLCQLSELSARGPFPGSADVCWTFRTDQGTALRRARLHTLLFYLLFAISYKIQAGQPCPLSVPRLALPLPGGLSLGSTASCHEHEHGVGPDCPLPPPPVPADLSPRLLIPEGRSAALSIVVDVSLR